MNPICGRGKAGTSCGERGERANLAEEFIELVVGTDPSPRNHIAAALADSAILCADPHRPNVLITAKLLELKRGMIRIL